MDTPIINKIREFCNKYEKVINIALGICVIFTFLYLVLNNEAFGTYNKDEIHAWNIATDLNFFEIIKLMRAEGHTFIWYMMLKPFTYRPDLFFPWIIKYLNLFFVILSVSLLWFFAPINKLIKPLIIFSYPFLSCFALLGRCYGIGIFLLTLIAILYKNRLKNPVIFSILLFLTANTSFMGALAVFGICLIYTYELLFKARNIIPILIMASIPVSLYIQWHNPVSPGYTIKEDFYFFFNYHMFYQYKHIGIPEIPKFVLLISCIVSLIYFRLDAKLLFSIITTYAIFLFFTLKIYMMFDYHYLFMFIIFCIFYWIYNDNREKQESKIILVAFNIIFISLCVMLSPYIRTDGYWFRDNYELNCSLSCLYKQVPKDSVIYTTMFSLGHEIPYLRDRYVLKTFNGDDLLSFDTYFNTYNPAKKYTNYNKLKLKTMDVRGRKKFIVVNKRFLAENFFAVRSKNKRSIMTDEFTKKSIKCEDLYIYEIKKESNKRLTKK